MRAVKISAKTHVPEHASEVRKCPGFGANLPPGRQALARAHLALPAVAALCLASSAPLVRPPMEGIKASYYVHYIEYVNPPAGREASSARGERADWADRCRHHEPRDSRQDDFASASKSDTQTPVTGV